MKEKRYYSQFLYIIKILFIVILLSLALYIVTEVSHGLAKKLSIQFRKNLVVIEYVVNGFVGIILGLSILLIVLRGKPLVIINDKRLKTNRFKKDFSELKSYHPSKGGSEPYVISHEGKQYDIELSWFSKKEREEIEILIQHQITAANQ